MTCQQHEQGRILSLHAGDKMLQGGSTVGIDMLPRTPRQRVSEPDPVWRGDARRAVRALARLDIVCRESEILFADGHGRGMARGPMTDDAFRDARRSILQHRLGGSLGPFARTQSPPSDHLGTSRSGPEPHGGLGAPRWRLRLAWVPPQEGRRAGGDGIISPPHATAESVRVAARVPASVGLGKIAAEFSLNSPLHSHLLSSFTSTLLLFPPFSSFLLAISLPDLFLSSLLCSSLRLSTFFDPPLRSPPPTTWAHEGR